MTISQGECPRGTCPEESSRVNRSKPVIPQCFPQSGWQKPPEFVVPPLVVPQSMSQTPGSSVGVCTEWSVISKPSITA